MHFLENIFNHLQASGERPVMQQVQEGRLLSSNGRQLLGLIYAARKFLLNAGLKKGDRCVLLAANDVRWAAVDLAAMAEGIIVVPLYSRQAPKDLARMIEDCTPSLVVCGEAGLRDGVAQASPQLPRTVLFEEIFAGETPHPSNPGWGGAPTEPSGADSEARPAAPLADSDPVTIIYTSGTSGEPKGVVLTAGNLNHMVRCTGERLDLLMGQMSRPERVFHYLPFCFAGSWILLLTCLSRNAVLTINTDLIRIKQDLEIAAPDYFLNVPTMLERMRAGILEHINKRGGVARSIFENAIKAYLGRQTLWPQGLKPSLDPILNGTTEVVSFHKTSARAAFGLREAFWLTLAGALVFPQIRASISPNLKALICGSAPLAVETQLFFMMLGIPVLQVYGLTETTAICTMDDPRAVVPGKVGPAIPGSEMKLGENQEILV
ncbi:MAG TPA: AMP-binding protein, partial [Terriglobales bacterium]|nr:AMP-binding protein [Terriglobales bacterium]